MNKEIKYKVWDKLKKEWFKPIYKAYKGKLEEVLISPSGYILLRTIDGLDATDKVQERFEIVQYTGLKDKNGKEIYEGDILETNVYDYSCGEFKEKRTTRYLAKFNFWAFRLFDLRNEGEFYSHHSDNTTLPLEIIGNIHKNKELIK